MSPVLIVGAGPTGLSLAIELKRRDVPFRLIEAREGRQSYSRAMGIQSRTLEVLEKMGVLTSFLKKGKQAKEFTLHWDEKKLSISLKGLDTPYPFVLILPQSESEALLRKHLEEQGGCVEWKTRLVGIDRHTATLELPSGEKQRAEYPWIIGCDGAHSSVRHALKTPFKGTKISETFLLADIVAHTPLPFNGPQVFLSKKGFGLLIPFPEAHTFRLVMPDAREAKTPQELTAMIKERGFAHPLEVTRIHMVSSFQIQRRHASKFRFNHIFLAGDAAHIHSPFGGQGMNTSIQDAFNLGWKLAQVVKGVSSETILDTYEAERLPVAKTVLNETTRMTRLLTFSQKNFPPLFYYGMRFLLSSKKRRHKIVELISEIGISYSENPLINQMPRDQDWEGPKAGHRAPDCRLADGKRVFELLQSPKFVLLLFSENASFAESIQREYGEWVDVHIVKGEAVRQKYAAESKSVYLIRPDGYIGYRSRQFKTEEVVSYLLKVFHPVSSRNKS